MRRYRKVAITGIFGACALAYAAETVSIQHGHPLAALTWELQDQYGYAVTYEEAPADTVELQTERLPNGTPFLSRPIVSIAFQMPEVLVGQAYPAALNRVPAGLPDVVQPLLDQYNSRAGGTMFSALFYGGYAHIVQTSRMVNGMAQPFQPILGTPVTMDVKGMSCSDALNSLLSQVNSIRGVHVVRARVPLNSLIQHECTVSVSNLPARDVLAGILQQAGAGVGHPRSSPTVYSWTLMHDPNTNKYFLATSIVPDLSGETVPAAVPAQPSAAGTTSPDAPSRLAAPVPKK